MCVAPTVSPATVTTPSPLASNCGVVKELPVAKLMKYPVETPPETQVLLEGCVLVTISVPLFSTGALTTRSPRFSVRSIYHPLVAGMETELLLTVDTTVVPMRPAVKVCCTRSARVNGVA